MAATYKGLGTLSFTEVGILYGKAEKKMLPACLLVTAHLCLSAPYIPVTQSSDMVGVHHKVDKSAVKRLGIQITAVWTDVSQPSPADLLNRVCEGGGCLYYLKHCDPKRMGCGYWFGELQTGTKGKRRLYLDEIAISYKTEKSLANAEANTYLAYGSRKHPSYIALSKLKISAQNFPPSCSTLNTGC